MTGELAEVLVFDRPIVFFDLETTGLGEEAKIVQIAGEKVGSDGKILHSFSQWIHPGCPIPEEATAVHGITDEDVVNKPSFKDLAPQLFEFFKGANLAGFNIINFDVPLLVKSFKDCGFDLDMDQIAVIDAMTIFHKHYKRDLTAAHQTYCGSSFEKAHDALSDVQATVRVLTAQLKTHKNVPNDIHTLHQYCNQKPDHFVDASGKLKWIDKKATFSFGKYRGKTLEWVHHNNNGYLSWLLDSDFPQDFKDIIRNAFYCDEFPAC